MEPNKENFKKSPNTNLSLNEFTCFYCRSEEPLAFHIEDFQVKLIGIACILIKSGSYKKEEFSSLINLKKVVKDNAEPLLRDWETFSEYLDPKIRKVDKDADMLEKKKSNNEVEQLCSFIEEFNDQLIEFRNNEVNKILEIQESSLSKAKAISQKIRHYKEFYDKIKGAIESDNISEASSVLSLLLNPESDLSENNFKKEIISITKMLNEYVESSEKNKSSLNIQSSLISRELSKEINDCMNNLTSVFKKIKSAIRKGNELKVNDPSSSNNNLCNNKNNIPNNNIDSNNFNPKFNHITHNGNYNNNNEEIHNNNHVGNATYSADMEIEQDNNISNNANVDIINSSTYTFGLDSKNSKHTEADNNNYYLLSEKQENKYVSSIINEPHRYLIHATISNTSPLCSIIVLQTNNKAIVEKVISNDLAKNKKELFFDSRFVNTGEGLLISGGLDKSKANSKQCVLIAIEHFDENKKTVDLVFHDLPLMLDGRRRHNMIHFKSTLFDSEKRAKSIVLCLSGLRSVSCEMINLDNLDSWKRLPDMHYSRSNATTLIMNDFVYVFGGFNAMISGQKSDKKEEYVKSVEFISLKEIASYSNGYNKNYSSDKWELLNVSSNYLSYCAYSVFYTNSKNFDNSFLICGGFDSKNHDETYKVTVSNLEDWKVELYHEKTSLSVLFLNSNFVQGENGFYYAFSFSGKLFEIQDKDNVKFNVLN